MIGKTTPLLPHNAVFQSPCNDIDGYSLRLVGESYRTNDLSAVDMSNEVPIHCPESQVTASSSLNTNHSIDHQWRSETVTRERNQGSSCAYISVYKLANPNYVCKYPEYHSPRERKIFCETIRKKLLKGAGEMAQCVKSLLCKHTGLSSDP